MAKSPVAPQGSIVAIWRYPVKSMIGEEIRASTVTERGLLGDRVYALVDVETGKVVSAKNPRKWGTLFDFRAEFTEPPSDTEKLPAARITFPDGAKVATDVAEIDDRLSASVGRPVRLASAVPDAPRIDGYWPDYEWLASPDQVFEVKLPAGTFFDTGVVHLLTTSTLNRLSTLRPESRFDLARFRPNIVIQTPGRTDGFVENEWIGRCLAIGDEVRLQIEAPAAPRDDDPSPRRASQGPKCAPDDRPAQSGKCRRSRHRDSRWSGQVRGRGLIGVRDITRKGTQSRLP